MNPKRNADGTLQIESPYCERHIAEFRRMGGKWVAPAWVFPALSEEMLSEYVDEQWGLGEPDTDVMVPVTSANYGKQALWHGYVLAERRARDYSVRLVESTGCDTKLPSSGGSRNNPAVNAPSEARFGLRIPRAFAVRHGLLTESAQELEPEHNPLAEYTTEQLLAELHARGIEVHEEAK